MGMKNISKSLCGSIPQPPTGSFSKKIVNDILIHILTLKCFLLLGETEGIEEKDVLEKCTSKFLIH